MAESRYTIRAILELLLKGKGAKDAEKQLKGAGKAAKTTKDELKKADKAAAGFGATLTRYLGGALLANFVRGAVQAFADWERQLRTTAVEAERLGLSVSATLRRVRELTIGIEEQTGILRQDTIPIFNKFLGLTGDVEQAAVLLRASVGAAEGGFKDLATAANLIGSILQGEVIEPSKSLGLAFDQATSSAEQQAIILSLALGKFLALSGGIDDTRGALDQMGAEANAQKLTLGEQLAPAVEVLRWAFSGLIKVIKSIFPAMQVMAVGTVGLVGALGKAAKAAFNPKNWIGGDFQKTVREAFESAFDDVVAGAESAVDILKETWNEGARGAIQTEEQRQKAIDELLKTANTRQQAAKDKAAKEAAEKELKAEVAMAEQGSVVRLEAQRRLLAMQRANALEAAEETGRAIAEQFAKVEAEIEAKIAEGGSEARIAQQKKLLEVQRTNASAAAEKSARDVAEINAKYDRKEEAIQREFDERRLAFDQQISDQLLRQQIEAAEEGSEERLKLELEMLERLRKRAIDAAIEKEADIAKVEELFDLMREGVIDEAEARRRAQGLKEREEYKKKSKDIIAILKKQAAEEIAIQNATFEREKALNAARREQAFLAAETAVMVGRLIFGENKALAIAETIIHTARGIMSALSMYPPNIPLAAFIAAQGAVQLRAIQEADIGKATLGPEFGGTGWAVSAAPAARTVPETATAAPTPETAEPAGDTVNVTIAGHLIGDEASIRRLARKLRRAERRDSARVAG